MRPPASCAMDNGAPQPTTEEIYGVEDESPVESNRGMIEEKNRGRRREACVTLPRTNKMEACVTPQRTNKMEACVTPSRTTGKEVCVMPLETTRNEAGVTRPSTERKAGATPSRLGENLVSPTTQKILEKDAETKYQRKRDDGLCIKTSEKA